MSYANRKQMSSNRTAAIIIVALIHIALGYALVTGLAYNVIKKAAEDLKTFDVEEEPPPPPEEPPPPPDQNTPPPPQIVAPPSIVPPMLPSPQINTIQEVRPAAHYANGADHQVLPGRHDRGHRPGLPAGGFPGGKGQGQSAFPVFDRRLSTVGDSQ